MLCLYAMDWYHLIQAKHATVTPLFQLTMLWYALIGIHHNEVRNLTATVLTEVCHNVANKPSLQPISAETFSNAIANTSDDIILSRCLGQGLLV